MKRPHQRPRWALGAAFLLGLEVAWAFLVRPQMSGGSMDSIVRCVYND